MSHRMVFGRELLHRFNAFESQPNKIKYWKEEVEWKG